MSTSVPFRRIALGASLVTALALAGCSTSDDSDASGASGDDGALETITEGKLTIATGEPAYTPWVENDDPESGEGFEAAIAYAVADELGFEEDDVVWIRTQFDTVIAPGPKDFDFNIQQFSANEEREQAVDFSSPYYETAQAIVTVEDSDAADAESLADLEGMKIGAASGSTSVDAVKDDIGVDPDVFNSNEDTVQALIAGNIDALVTDLPTAFYNADAVLDDGVLLGQFESEQGGDELALLLEKDSPLTDAVTEAVDTLREDGVLDDLAEEWLADKAGAEVLS